MKELRQMTFSFPSKDLRKQSSQKLSINPLRNQSFKTLTTKTAADCRQNERRLPIFQISAKQLEARRMARRASNFTNENEGYWATDPAEVPLSKSLIRENLIVRWNVILLVVTICIQTIAIFWNIFALWSPERPNVWHNNWETNTSKAIITVTCIMLMIIVISLRLIDLNQLPKECPRARNYIFIVFESAFLMVHIPPHSLKMGFKVEDDLWNVMGTAKFYLFLELCKLSHPLWLRRYEAAAARIQSRRTPHMIGTVFCATGRLSQCDPMDVFVFTLLIALGMFTMWIFFIERTRTDFNLVDTVDYVLSSFFSVPTAADHQVLRTLTGRTIKIFTGLFSMCYGAIIGWTFGFRVAENTQTIADLLEDVNAYINYRQRQAKRIQKWWRRLKGKLRPFGWEKESGELRWSQVMTQVRKNKLKSLMLYTAKQTIELTGIKRSLKEIEGTNQKLLRENEKLSIKNDKLSFANTQLEQLLVKCMKVE